MKYTFKRLVALTALIGTITTHCYGMNDDTQNEGAAAAAAAPRTASSTTRTGSVEYTTIDEHTIKCALIPIGGMYGAPTCFVPSYDPSALRRNVRRLEIDLKDRGFLTIQELWQGLLHILTPLEENPSPLPSVQEIVFDFLQCRGVPQHNTPLLQGALQAVGTLLPNLRSIGNKQANCFDLREDPILLRRFFPGLETLDISGSCSYQTALSSDFLRRWVDGNPGINFTLVRTLRTEADLRLLPATHPHSKLTHVTYELHRNTYPNLAPRVSLRFDVELNFRNINPDGTFDFLSEFIKRGYTQSPHDLTSLQQLVESTYIPDLRKAFQDGRRVDLTSLPDSHRQGILDYLNENRAELDAERRPIMQRDPWVCTLGTEGRILAQAYKWLHENSEDVANGSALSSSSPLVVLPAILSENTGLLQRMAGEHYRGFPVDLDGVQEVSFGQALSYLLSQR